VLSGRAPTRGSARERRVEVPEPAVLDAATAGVGYAAVPVVLRPAVEAGARDCESEEMVSGDREPVITPEHLANVERIRAWLATVPLGVSKGGVTFVDFAAWRRGERRTK
jgi:hypothetical protein